MTDYEFVLFFYGEELDVTTFKRDELSIVNRIWYKGDCGKAGRPYQYNGVSVSARDGILENYLLHLKEDFQDVINNAQERKLLIYLPQSEIHVAEVVLPHEVLELIVSLRIYFMFSA